MKGLIKYWKYARRLSKLNRAIKFELWCEEFCEESSIDFDDLNLRSIRKARDKIKATWLRRNMID